MIVSPPLFIDGGERFVVFEGPVAVTRNLRNGAVLSEVSGKMSDFYQPVWSTNRGLIAARRGGWIAVFRTDDLAAEPVKVHHDNGKRIWGLAFHPTGRFLAATSNDHTVKLYDTTTWKVAQRSTGAWGGRDRSRSAPMGCSLRREATREDRRVGCYL